MSDNASVTIVLLAIIAAILLGVAIPVSVGAWRDVKMAEHGYVQQDLGSGRGTIWVKGVK